MCVHKGKGAMQEILQIFSPKDDKYDIDMLRPRTFALVAQYR